MSTKTILLLSLSSQPWFDDMYSKLLNQLSKKATVTRISNASEATTYLTSTTPTAILATDPGITERRNAGVLDKVLTYVRGGGTLILGCMFSSFIGPLDMNKFFQNKLGLPWKTGDYSRTVVSLNRDIKGITQRLPGSYSQKALFLKEVERGDSLYAPSSSSVVQSMVFAPMPVNTQQAAVAWKKFEEGWVGYIGDVNGEAESDTVILAMCGCN